MSLNTLHYNIWGVGQLYDVSDMHFFIVDVPSSFSPFVEFKEKTQQWKLLGECLVLLFSLELSF